MKINKSQSVKPRLCRASLNLSVPPDTIPTLISVQKLNELTKGDDNPYFVIEEIIDIDKPVQGVTYTPEFWQSFLSKISEAPLPGSKSGHTDPWNWFETGDMDFFTVGGDIRGNSVFLKMYVPPQGYKSSNETFIKALKTGVVHFSIVSWTEDLIEVDEDGEIVSIKAIRSVKGERNDAAERNMGAMDQKVNKAGGEPLDENKKEVSYIMPEPEYNEIISNLKNRCNNGVLSVEKICKDLGFEIVKDAHKNAIKTLKEITDLTGENPVEKIKQMKANEIQVKQTAYDNVREKLMFEAFGPEKIEVDGKPEINLKRNAAEPHVKKEIQTEEALKENIEEAKQNPVVQNISFQTADVNSDLNDLSGGVSAKTNQKKYRTEEHVTV